MIFKKSFLIEVSKAKNHSSLLATNWVCFNFFLLGCHGSRHAGIPERKDETFCQRRKQNGAEDTDGHNETASLHGVRVKCLRIRTSVGSVWSRCICLLCFFVFVLPATLSEISTKAYFAGTLPDSFFSHPTSMTSKQTKCLRKKDCTEWITWSSCVHLFESVSKLDEICASCIPEQLQKGSKHEFGKHFLIEQSESMHEHM